MADAEEEGEDVAAVAFLEVAAAAAEVAAAAAFRGVVAAVFRARVEEISPAGVPIAPLARGIFPAAAAEAVVWLIPGTPHRATEVPLASG